MAGLYALKVSEPSSQAADEAPLPAVLDVTLRRHEDERLANQVLRHADAHKLVDELSFADVAADGDAALDLRLDAVQLRTLLVREHHAVHHTCATCLTCVKRLS